jgi:hypothetical protein
MNRAKSRLHSSDITHERAASATHHKKIFFAHAKHLPAFFLSLPFYGAAFYIFTRIQPNLIRHWLIPNSYLPLLVVMLIANTFLFGFLFLNTRRGLVVSLLLTVLLFLKLQLVIFTPGLIFIMLISFGIIELLLTGLTKYHANISQRSH